MTCVFASSGNTKGFGNCIIMELFLVCVFEVREQILLIFKEKGRDSLDMPHVNKNCSSNVTHDLTQTGKC